MIEAPLLPKGFHAAWLGLQSAISIHLSKAAAREVAAGRIRELPHHLLFNTWIGLVHHYIVNRDLFAPGGSVLEAHGRTLLHHFLTLISKGDPR